VLSDADLRGLFDANGLVLRRSIVDREPRDLEAYLDLAGCEGDARTRAEELAQAVDAERVRVGWYLLERR
jgi:hypothetical protein